MAGPLVDQLNMLVVKFCGTEPGGVTSVWAATTSETVGAAVARSQVKARELRIENCGRQCLRGQFIERVGCRRVSGFSETDEAIPLTPLKGSYGNGRFNARVGVVTDEFEVFVVKLVDVLDDGVQFHLRQRARLAGEL